MTSPSPTLCNCGMESGWVHTTVDPGDGTNLSVSDKPAVSTALVFEPRSTPTRPILSLGGESRPGIRLPVLMFSRIIVCHFPVHLSMHSIPRIFRAFRAQYDTMGINDPVQREKTGRAVARAARTRGRAVGGDVVGQVRR